MHVHDLLPHVVLQFSAHALSGEAGRGGVSVCKCAAGGRCSTPAPHLELDAQGDGEDGDGEGDGEGDEEGDGSSGSLAHV